MSEKLVILHLLIQVGIQGIVAGRKKPATWMYHQNGEIYIYRWWKITSVLMTDAIFRETHVLHR